MYKFSVDLTELEYTYKHVKYATKNYNPIPCPRITGKMMFMSKQWAKYTEYKKHIKESFIATFEEPPENIFQPNQKYDCFIKVAFKDKKHGDIADNIVKPILDSIFCKESKLNDKLIQTHTSFCYNSKTSLDVIFIDDLDIYFEDYIKACRWLKNK